MKMLMAILSALNLPVRPVMNMNGLLLEYMVWQTISLIPNALPVLLVTNYRSDKNKKPFCQVAEGFFSYIQYEALYSCYEIT
jgi:hypothetical protein